MAIMHRKNSPSYKTLNGARIGNMFMSLIHTCRLNRVNPFGLSAGPGEPPRGGEGRPSASLPRNYPKPETTSAPHHNQPGQPA